MKKVLFIILCSIFVFPASSFAYFNSSGTNENVYYDFGQAFDNVTSVTIRSSGSIAVSLLNVQNSTIWSESVPVSSTLKDTTYTFSPAINNVKVFSAFLTNPSTVTNVSIFNGSTLLKSSGDYFTKTKPDPSPTPTPAPTPAGLLRGLPLNTYSSNGSSAAYGQIDWTDNNNSTYKGLPTNGGYMEYAFASATSIKSYKLYTYSQSNTTYESLSVVLYNGVNILKSVSVTKINGTEVDLSTDNVTKIRVVNNDSSNVNYISEFDVFGVLSAPTPTVTPTVGPTATPTVAPTPTPTPSPTPAPALKPTLDVVIAPEKIGLGKEFTADVALKNVKDIYAEDFEVKYDKEHLQYLGFEEVIGYKVYNKPVDQNGTVRFVVASQGEEYGINEDTVIVKLKFKAKAKGTAVVDATKARIADTEEEYDLETVNCLEDSVIIEATDVNKSGTFTLVDLAIDARYFKYFAPDVDPVKYNAQQAGDEYVNDDDLLFIVDQILNNPDYLPNS
ncbi:cohesin domain-containing protein [Paenibacillus sp. FSL H7-0350]|uniref:cohesin domain-containing protein n=1 Tax=Paenibacillus sp. FSL H7-0350 TaxID=2975345 RepID=UPI0031586E3F